MTNKSFLGIVATILFLYSFHAQAQDYTFTNVHKTASTIAKDQGRTGTCWSFSTTSFIESEALRQGKGEFDLSEMFFVRQMYPRKAAKYIAAKGKWRFSEGGLSHDVLYAAKNIGCMPNSVYDGLSADGEYNHAEMDAVLKAILDAALANNGTVSQQGMTAFENVLDTYLGKLPSGFWYDSVYYSPADFGRNVVGFNPDDYIEITSFTQAPFYTQFALDIPDNWSKGVYYNVPLDDLIEIMESSLSKGYSLVWDGDVSEDEFMHRKGVALWPELKWSDRTAAQKQSIGTTYEPEAKVTQAMRQASFEDETTTDDHLMHITGTATDARGTRYFYTKNSWGCTSNSLDGFLYMSEAYVRMKSISILVHKDVVPKKIASKLGL